MKKAIIMLFFVLINLVCFAPVPDRPIIYIEKSVPVITIPNVYEPLIDAISIVEANKCDSAINIKEMAVGRLQIRQCKVDHYNKLTKRNYTLKDMHDFKKAKEVFLYFAKGKTFEKAAKDWNGSGPKTEIYWKKVQNYLQV